MAAPSSTKKKPRKYLLTLTNERTLERVWGIHLTGTGAVLVTGIGVTILLVVFSCIILFTPLRRLLPKNTEEFRDEMVAQAMRVDSLQTVIDVQSEYLRSLRTAMAGVIPTDTLVPLDSMEVIVMEQLLEARSQATADFLIEYEALDSLAYFDINDTTQLWKD